MKSSNIITFVRMVNILKKYWSENNCVIVEPLDISVGAGTFHPETFFRCLGPESFFRAFVQPSRRPNDGRYGNNPNRLQHYYQFQVVLKPSPENVQILFLNSLKKLQVDCKNVDVRFVEDNWENPTLGASGIGWEVWINGMEVAQFTYFQQVGGIECNPISVEITYGLERLCMYLQNIDNVYDILWSVTKNGNMCIYKELFLLNEKEQSKYNFENSNINMLYQLYNTYIEESKRLLTIKDRLIIPAYENLLRAIHNFNLLDSRKVFSVSERQKHILRICSYSKLIARKFCLENKKDNV